MTIDIITHHWIWSLIYLPSGQLWEWTEDVRVIEEVDVGGLIFSRVLPK